MKMLSLTVATHTHDRRRNFVTFGKYKNWDFVDPSRSATWTCQNANATVG